MVKKTEALFLLYLDEQLLNLHVVDDRAVSPRTFSESPLARPGALQAHAAGERTGTVRNQLNILKVSRVQRVRCVLVFGGQALVDAPLRDCNCMLHWSEQR